MRWILVDLLLTVGITGLAMTGRAYRGVYMVLVPLGIAWLVLSGLVAGSYRSKYPDEPEMSVVISEIADLGGAVAAGGFFGSILFRKRVAPTPEAKLDSKKCPDCAETVLADARKCRFCGYQF